MATLPEPPALLPPDKAYLARVVAPITDDDYTPGPVAIIYEGVVIDIIDFSTYPAYTVPQDAFFVEISDDDVEVGYRYSRRTSPHFLPPVPQP